MEELLARIPQLVAARYPLIWVQSAEEDRVERGLAKIAAAQGIQLFRWRSSTGLQRGLAADSVALPDTLTMAGGVAYIATVTGPAFFLFEDASVWMDDPTMVRRLRDLEPELEQRKQAVVFLSHTANVPRELEKDIAILDAPLPDRREIAKLLAVLLDRQAIAVPPERFDQFITASLGLTEKEIKRAYARMLLEGRRFEEKDVAALLDEKARMLRRSRFLEFIKPDMSMAQVGGLENLKLWLNERTPSFSDRARQYGLPEPKGLFLLGVQGCGKSLSAKAVADLWHLPLLRLDVATLFAGRAEEGLRDTIAIAESLAPVVLWIDEIEKGFLSEGGGGGRVFGSFLTWMQDKQKPVFVVATANDVRALPPELLRKGRFDEIFFVDLPNVHERLQILDIHLRRKNRNPDEYDLLAIAEDTERYSGAELEQLVVAALFRGFSAGREMSQGDLVRVARDTIPLAVTMDDRLKELREWARPRARPASVDTRRIAFFADWASEDVHE
ncbi:MAG: AAA family ATPase [Myxococcales bacterium]|nr:AAA family ATPase [Myxococcales bacterium]